MGVALLDANILVALAWPEHEFHERAGRWFVRHSRAGWATCPFTQAALVRVLSNPAFSSHSLTPQNALAVLETNLKLPGHRFWPADISIAQAASLVGHRLTGHRQITDMYLLGLAIHNRGRLATLDRALKTIDPDDTVDCIA